MNLKNALSHLSGAVIEAVGRRPEFEAALTVAMGVGQPTCKPGDRNRTIAPSEARSYSARRWRRPRCAATGSSESGACAIAALVGLGRGADLRSIVGEGREALRCFSTATRGFIRTLGGV